MKITIWFIRSERTQLKEDKINEDITKAFMKNSIERVFNLIRFINKKYIRFNPSRDY